MVVLYTNFALLGIHLFGGRSEVEVEILGMSWDAVVVILLVVGWFVLMRFVLPRLGVST